MTSSETERNVGRTPPLSEDVGNGYVTKAPTVCTPDVLVARDPLARCGRCGFRHIEHDWPTRRAFVCPTGGRWKAPTVCTGDVPAVKACTRCGVAQAIANFGWKIAGKRRDAQCRACRTARVKEWRRKDPAGQRAKMRAAYAAADTQRKYGRRNAAKRRERLTDAYVATCLEMTVAATPPALIAAKRALILMRRALRDSNND